MHVQVGRGAFSSTVPVVAGASYSSRTLPRQDASGLRRGLRQAPASVEARPGSVPLPRSRPYGRDRNLAQYGATVELLAVFLSELLFNNRYKLVINLSFEIQGISMRHAGGPCRLTAWERQDAQCRSRRNLRVAIGDRIGRVPRVLRQEKPRRAFDLPCRRRRISPLHAAITGRIRHWTIRWSICRDRRVRIGNRLIEFIGQIAMEANHLLGNALTSSSGVVAGRQTGSA